MTTVTQNPLHQVVTQEAKEIHKNWGWILALGIAQIMVGMYALSFAFSSTLASVLALGILLLIAAGAQLAAAVWARPLSESLAFFLLGILYNVAALLTLRHPLLAAEGLTLMLAAIFIVGGIFRMVAALVERIPGRGLIFFNGIITLLLGLLIWQQWPTSGLWVLGMFLGIDLIINGVIWAVLAVGVRSGVPR